MAQIKLDKITKTWGHFQAVKETSLDIQDQEFLVLLGPSGCGKTTTMRMIAGLETPTSGDILIDGKVVNHIPPKDRSVAMVFQSYALYAHLTVYENICFPLRVRKVPKSEWKGQALAAASMVELDTLLDRYPRELSGGQRQRVALARAIVRKAPNCFLMDEPLSNLDAKLRVTMRTEIKRLQQTLKITTVYVTHDQVEAMTLADRVALMKHGEIQQIDTPKHIYDNPATLFVAGFIGSPAMNLVKGRVEHGRFITDGITINIQDGMHQDNVTLGIRAEDLHITTADSAEISGTVYAFEQLGDCNTVILAFEQDRIVAKIPKDTYYNRGDTIHLKSPNHNYYLFDNATEKRILFS